MQHVHKSSISSLTAWLMLLAMVLHSAERQKEIKNVLLLQSEHVTLEKKVTQTFWFDK